jgi:DNA-binding XRE family transcriptional regulator
VLSSATTCLWKSFRRSRTQFRDRPETVRLHPGTAFTFIPGILFGINPERRSESSRNRVHLAPDSPIQRSYLADLERGYRNPSVRTLVKVANALKVSVPELFEEAVVGKKR